MALKQWRGGLNVQAQLVARRLVCGSRTGGFGVNRGGLLLWRWRLCWQDAQSVFIFSQQEVLLVGTWWGCFVSWRAWWPGSSLLFYAVATLVGGTFLSWACVGGRCGVYKWISRWRVSWWQVIMISLVGQGLTLLTVFSQQRVLHSLASCSIYVIISINFCMKTISWAKLNMWVKPPTKICSYVDGNLVVRIEARVFLFVRIHYF